MAFTMLLLLAACTGVESTSQLIPETTVITSNEPTGVVLLPTDLPQNTPQGAEATPVPIPGDMTPIVVEQPTRQTTFMPAPTNSGMNYPPALLQMEKPGEMSRLISPFLVTANVYPGDQGMVNVQMFGEDGRLMSDQLIQLTTTESGWVSLATEIKFESISAGESALVVLSTRDGFGRRIAQVGMPVVLLQIGESEMEPAKFTRQPVLLQLPVVGGFAKKGTLHLEGQIHLFNNNPIIVEMVTQTGGIVANKAVFMQVSDNVEFVPFAFDMPYTVSKRTPVRLTIRQASEISSAVDISLYSQVIYLDP